MYEPEPSAEVADAAVRAATEFAALVREHLDRRRSSPADDLTTDLLSAGLTDDERLVVVLHHLADRRVDDIAEELGVPVGTVKSRLSRGRAHLAGLMAEPVESEEAERHA